MDSPYMNQNLSQNPYSITPIRPSLFSSPVSHNLNPYSITPINPSVSASPVSPEVQHPSNISPARSVRQLQHVPESPEVTLPPLPPSLQFPSPFIDLCEFNGNEYTRMNSFQFPDEKSAWIIGPINKDSAVSSSSVINQQLSSQPQNSEHLASWIRSQNEQQHVSTQLFPQPLQFEIGSSRSRTIPRSYDQVRRAAQRRLQFVDCIAPTTLARSSSSLPLRKAVRPIWPESSATSYGADRRCQNLDNSAASLASSFSQIVDSSSECYGDTLQTFLGFKGYQGVPNGNNLETRSSSMHHDVKLAAWPSFDHGDNGSLSRSVPVGIHSVVNNDHVEAAQSVGMLPQIQNGQYVDLSPGMTLPRRKHYSVGVDSLIRCHCKKSRCLKLYCDCFNSTGHCGESCKCENCLNKAEHREKVDEVKKQIFRRDPRAFISKVVQDVTDPPAHFMEKENPIPTSSLRHRKGCNCRKAKCEKKYCECFLSQVGCSNTCRCENCRNYYGRKPGPINIGGQEGGPSNENPANAVKDDAEHLPGQDPIKLLPLQPDYSFSANASSSLDDKPDMGSSSGEIKLYDEDTSDLQCMWRPDSPPNLNDIFPNNDRT